jgi:hypothetical protein
MRPSLPGARLGNCLRHALNKFPGKLTAIPSPMRKALRFAELPVKHAATHFVAALSRFAAIAP